MSVDAPPGQLTIDGLSPSSIIAPSSVDELAARLRDADERGAAVIPIGSGLHLSLGNPPARYDLALRTSALTRVIEHEPADLTITVEAGITMRVLQRALAQHGQFLPIDAPADATIGGVLAAGLSGPSRHAYGLPRDWLIGCRVAHVDGTISKGGGRVVKNVAGYDMPKLAVGSLGSLGVIVEATFKVAPLPAAQETFLATCESHDAAFELVRAVDDRGLALRAIAVVGRTTAAFWLAGPSSAVERTAREVLEIARGAQIDRRTGIESTSWWQRVIEARPIEGIVTMRASVPPASCGQFVEDLAALGASCQSLPTTGLVFAEISPVATESLVAAIKNARQLAERLAGSLVVTSAPVDVKQRIDVWGPSDALPLMRTLKHQFDPKGTLSPGRFIGGI